MFQSFVQIQTTWQYNACVIGNHRKCKSKNCFRLMTLLDITYCIIILCVRQNMSYCLHLSLLFVVCAFLYINVHVLLLKKKKKKRIIDMSDLTECHSARSWLHSVTSETLTINQSLNTGAVFTEKYQFLTSTEFRVWINDYMYKTMVHNWSSIFLHQQWFS